MIPSTPHDASSSRGAGYSPSRRTPRGRHRGAVDDVAVEQRVPDRRPCGRVRPRRPAQSASMRPAVLHRVVQLQPYRRRRGDRARPTAAMTRASWEHRFVARWRSITASAARGVDDFMSRKSSVRKLICAATRAAAARPTTSGCTSDRRGSAAPATSLVPQRQLAVVVPHIALDGVGTGGQRRFERVKVVAGAMGDRVGVV